MIKRHASTTIVLGAGCVLVLSIILFLSLRKAPEHGDPQYIFDLMDMNSLVYVFEESLSGGRISKERIDSWSRSGDPAVPMSAFFIQEHPNLAIVPRWKETGILCDSHMNLYLISIDLRESASGRQCILTIQRRPGG